MKHCLLILSLMLIGSGFLSIEAASIDKKENLRILYVGQDPSVSLRKYDLISAGAIVEEQYAEDIRWRMSEFRKMLETFFEQVECVDADKYTPDLSKLYDVTVFDALPPCYFSSGIKSYLPKDYDCPTIFIGHVAALMGESLGLKMDWYCMCLKEHALQVKYSHPIFKGPFVTDITFEERPTPTTVYNYISGNKVPLKLPMWRVQKEYIKGYRIGMVSHGDAFEDSPDAEVITGGECLKSIDAVAIARHGNFLMWGFAASPRYMTEEAQHVFANAICYINQFKGKVPIVRKIEKGMTVRERIQENLDVLKTSTYKAYCRRVKEVGKKPLLYKDFLKLYLHKDLYASFGTDEDACRDFLKENMDYFYGKDYSFVIDKEVKSLHIANNDKRLLDKCICLLEQGQDTVKARNILTRYTSYEFPTPEAWREWFETCQSKLFFTESGGYQFKINDNQLISFFLPYEKSHTRRSIGKKQTVDSLTRDKPVVFMATLQNKMSGKGEIVLSGHILDGFHIYASATEDCPFYLTKVNIELPEGYRKIGELNVSSSHPMAGNDAIQIYEGKVIFKQRYEGHSFHMNPVVRCKVTYQCCDNDICMPPVTDEFELPLY